VDPALATHLHSAARVEATAATKGKLHTAEGTHANYRQ